MISYTLVLRRSEIGIRMALGANNRRILGMALVALAASLLPAQRATTVQPMQTLRTE